jgi:hypothetical protein
MQGYIEQELLHQLKMGDEDAYQSVFHNYFPALVAFANNHEKLY